MAYSEALVSWQNDVVGTQKLVWSRGKIKLNDGDWGKNSAALEDTISLHFFQNNNLIRLDLEPLKD